MSEMIEPRELFGSKLGLVLGAAGKDKTRVRYVIIYKIRPVKEMMVRYGVCHKNCTKAHIMKANTPVIINIDCGLFGLDGRGFLRKGDLLKMKHPKGLKFDGFRGIELLPQGNKYAQWLPNFETAQWEPRMTMVKGAMTKMAISYYPFKEALMDMPSEILHDGPEILIPATEAVGYMQAWLKRMQGRRVMMDAPEISNDTMGTMVGQK